MSVGACFFDERQKRMKRELELQKAKTGDFYI